MAGLLAESVGTPTDAALKELIESCATDEFPRLYIASFHSALVGVLRVDAYRRSQCTITHIAVAHRFRGQGIGQRLIEFIRDEMNFVQAEAETDDDALGFYRACGFEIDSLGEDSFGNKRFRCVIRF